MDYRRRPLTNGASQSLRQQMGPDTEAHARKNRQRHQKQIQRQLEKI